MKKFLTTAALILSTSTSAWATDFVVQGKITTVEPNYLTKEIGTPYKECYNVEVPVYGNVGGSGASASDVLGGMIIGGLIGKGATGKDNGAAAGAVIGGMVAADKKTGQQGIVGYRQEQRCETRYKYETVRELKNYTITYEWNGYYGSTTTYYNFRVGDTVNLSMTLRAK